MSAAMGPAIFLCFGVLFAVPGLTEPWFRARDVRPLLSRFMLRVLLAAVAAGMGVLAAATLQRVPFLEPELRRMLVLTGAVALVGVVLWWVFPGVGYWLDSSEDDDAAAARRRAAAAQADAIARAKAVPLPFWSKALWVLVFAVLAVLLYGVQYATFLPTAEAVAWGEQARAPLLAVMAVAALPFLRRRHHRKARPLLYMMLLVPLGALLWAFVWYAGGEGLAAGTGALQAQLSPGTPGAVEVTVIQTGSARSRRGCDGRVSVRPSDWLDGTEIDLCGIPLDLHSQLQAGDRMRLTGFESPLGLRYTQVQLLR
ncbi:MAG: hypothetical protein AAGE76_09215 [Pseudomonadota bacterium]